MTDDMPYYLYSAAYGAANCLPEFTSASLYDTRTWQGLLTFIGIRTSAGMIAGASLQECIQLLRARHIYHELIVFPDDVHETLLHKRWLYTFDRMETFLNKFLSENAATKSAGK